MRELAELKSRYLRYLWASSQDSDTGHNEGIPEVFAYSLIVMEGQVLGSRLRIRLRFPVSERMALATNRLEFSDPKSGAH